MFSTLTTPFITKSCLLLTSKVVTYQADSDHTAESCRWDFFMGYILVLSSILWVNLENFYNSGWLLSWMIHIFLLCGQQTERWLSLISIVKLSFIKADAIKILVHKLLWQVTVSTQCPVPESTFKEISWLVSINTFWFTMSSLRKINVQYRQDLSRHSSF